VLTFEDAAGEAVELSRFRGRPILVNVWATWCRPCREEIPSLDRLQGLARETGIDVIAISVDRVGRDQIKAFLSVAGVENLALYRGDPDAVLRAFAVVGLPTTLLLDAEGREVARLVGPTTWDAPAVVERLRALATTP
jgi:thiol-disulfide isomerase/thioredoxin